VAEEDRARIDELVTQYRLSDGLRDSALRRNAMACVAFPMCGLAMAEAERYLPTLLTEVERIMLDAGLVQDEIVLRMTGCPNGCARPYVAEIALVGKSLDHYNLYLGGDFVGQRLNKLYRENIATAEILEILREIMPRYARERQPGEHFGDFAIRAGYVRAVERGREFHG
jgi:sulfite reductase (NADPH) hemoprotein beta-component